MNIRSIADIGECKYKRALVRVDFNVPLQDNKVVDPMRIEKSLKTIQFLRDKGVKVILISHIEGKGGVSLAPVAEYLNQKFPVTFIKDLFGEETENMLYKMRDGEVVLLENLRNDPGEKANDIEFAKKLSLYGDFYVNDAFSVSHRAHASVVALPSLLPHYAGFEIMEEIEHLSTVFHPPRPFFFILGGAKFDTKMPLIEKFLKLSDHIFVGGALANNFFKEKGMALGKSLVSDGNFNLSQYFNDTKLILPVDVIVADATDASKVSTKRADEVGENDIIMDIGPDSLASIVKTLGESKFVLWNGPMGNYELGFKDQTIGIAQAIADSKIDAALGGGDTTAALASIDIEDDSHIFVSTGGGAMLQFLLDETLPGIDALK